MTIKSFFSNMLVIMKKELIIYFTTPIAYIVFSAFLLTTGLYFFVLSPFFFYGQADLREFFGSLPWLFSIAIPAVTMRLLSEEEQSGSIEIIMTLPVTTYDIVLGKFFAATVFVGVMLIPTLIYVVTVAMVGSIDLGPVLGGYLGALFLAGACVAIGVFTSSLSKNQIIAFIIGMGICLALTLTEYFRFFLPGKMVNIIEFFGLKYHFMNIAKGIVDSRDILYFLSIIAFSLMGTVKILEDRR